MNTFVWQAPSCQLLLESTQDPPTVYPRKTYLRYFMPYICTFFTLVSVQAVNEDLSHVSTYERSANNQ